MLESFFSLLAVRSTFRHTWHMLGAHLHIHGDVCTRLFQSSSCAQVTSLHTGSMVRALFSCGRQCLPIRQTLAVGGPPCECLSLRYHLSDHFYFLCVLYAICSWFLQSVEAIAQSRVRVRISVLARQTLGLQSLLQMWGFRDLMESAFT